MKYNHLDLTLVRLDSTVESLYIKADRSMYKAKHEEGNYYVYE